jgi:response regulator of citrate/malate metabolism
VGKITSKKRLENFYRIYEQIYQDNTMSIFEIAQNTGLSRNTVAKYLEKMYEKDILKGPYFHVLIELSQEKNLKPCMHLVP